MSEFVPDLIIAKGSPLFPHAKCYFKGELHLRVFEARIKLASFEQPAFGEVLVGCIPDAPTIMRPPQLGEIDHEGLWAHLECGQVYIELDEQGKELLEKIKSYL